MTCPMCGANTSRSVEQYHYVESGLDNVFVAGTEVYKCKCGETYVQLPGVENVHGQIATALLHKNSLLTGSEAKFIRKWLGLKSEELARALGYTRVSVSRWENKSVPESADRALRLYASSVGHVPINFSQLFASLSPTPERHYRITVGETPFMSSTVLSRTFSASHEFSVTFERAIQIARDSEQAGNQELAQAA